MGSLRGAKLPPSPGLASVPPWACCQLPGSRPDGSLVLTRGQELEEASSPEGSRTGMAGQREARRMAWVADLANGSWLLFLL